jgi:hypothetical protein
MVWGYGLGSTSYDAGVAVATSPNGNVVLGATFRGTVDFDGGPGATSLTTTPGGGVAIVTYDSLGALLNAGSLDASTDLTLYDLHVGGNGRIHSVGYFSGMIDLDPGPGVMQVSGAGFANAYISVLDASGNYVWGGQLSGSGAGIRAWDVDTDALGNIYVGGTFTGTVDFDPGPMSAMVTAGGGPNGDAFVLKLDPQGNFLWVQAVPSGVSNYDAYIAVDPLSADVWLAFSFGMTVDLDPGPGTLLVTAQNVDLALVRFDSSGNFQWGNQIGGTVVDSLRPITMGPGGLLFMAGSMGGPGDADPGPGVFFIEDCDYIIGVDASGNLVRFYQFVGLSSGLDGAPITSLGFSPAGDLYVTGSIRGTVDLDPGPGVLSVYGLIPASNDNPPSFLLKIDAGGTLDWMAPTTLINDLAVGPNAELYVTGSHFNPIDLDPSGGTLTLTSAGNRDIFVARYESLALDLAQPGPGAPVSVTHRGLRPGSEYVTAFSLDVCPGLPGSGPIFGLCASSPASLQFLVGQVTQPLGTPIFHFNAGQTTIQWPPVPVPPLTAEGVCLRLAGGGVEAASQVTRFTTQ